VKRINACRKNSEEHLWQFLKIFVRLVVDNITEFITTAKGEWNQQAVFFVAWRLGWPDRTAEKELLRRSKKTRNYRT